MCFTSLLCFVGIEYAYMEAPVNMQGVVMGLFWFCAGIGNFIGVCLPYIFSHIYGIWQNSVYINCDRLDIFFYTLAVLLFLFSLVFILLAKHTDLGLTNVMDMARAARLRAEIDSMTHGSHYRRRNLLDSASLSNSQGTN